jgi:hypothetical protein
VQKTNIKMKIAPAAGFNRESPRTPARISAFAIKYPLMEKKRSLMRMGMTR